MRIIGGLARGTKLYTLEGMNTRPTPYILLDIKYMSILLI